jgi:hypothetical protein
MVSIAAVVSELKQRMVSTGRVKIGWRHMSAVCGLFLMGAVLGQAQPVVSNVSATQDPATGTVDIWYQLSSPVGPCTISLQISSDGGGRYDIVPQTLSGDIGPGIQPGAQSQDHVGRPPRLAQSVLVAGALPGDRG